MDDAVQSGFGLLRQAQDERSFAEERDLGLPGEGSSSPERGGGPAELVEGHGPESLSSPRDWENCRVPLHHPADGSPPRAGEELATVLTPTLKARFLDELSRHGNVRVAASRMGVSRSGLYLARRRDSAFDSAWRGALCCARDHAEAVLAERALEGVEEPVFFRGELIATRRRFDSRLLLAHLARLDQLCGPDGQGGQDFDLALARVLGVAAESGLPGDRAGHVERAAEAAGERFDAVTQGPDPRDPYDYEPEPEDEPFYENEAIRAAEEVEQAYEAAEARYDAARAARMAEAAALAGAEWDARHLGVWDAVDAVLGAAPNAHPAATNLACGSASLAPLPFTGGVGGGPDRPAEFKSLYPVQCVQWARAACSWRGVN